MEKLTDILRRAIKDSGLSQYAISQRTLVSASALSRFMRGERGLSSEAIDELVAFLGLEVRPRRKRKGE
jgi:transcriptional regulator with XRE-family HTH domain